MTKQIKLKINFDHLTDEECLKIVELAVGQSQDIKITSIDRRCNGNNIPHIVINIKYLDQVLFEEVKTHIGVFHNLNIYQGSNFSSVYSQCAIFKYFKDIELYE